MKKNYYEKIVTWEKKPDYLGILGCFAFMTVGLWMCFMVLYSYGVPVQWWVFLGIFVAMFLFGMKNLDENFPRGREVRYKKI